MLCYVREIVLTEFGEARRDKTRCQQLTLLISYYELGNF